MTAESLQVGSPPWACLEACLGLLGSSGGWVGWGQRGLGWAGLEVAAGLGAGTRGVGGLGRVGLYGELEEGLPGKLCLGTQPLLPFTRSFVHSLILFSRALLSSCHPQGDLRKETDQSQNTCPWSTLSPGDRLPWSVVPRAPWPGLLPGSTPNFSISSPDLL